MTMEEFVTYELAVKLKEKGFDWCKITTYNPKTKVRNNHIVPSISQVLKWLREKKGWVIVVRLYSTNGWYWFVQDEKGELISSHLAFCDDCFSTYEEAAIVGIEYVLDNLI